MSDVTTDPPAAEVTALANALTDDLTARHLLTSELWRQALNEVPRHLFVPATGWACPEDDGDGVNRAIDHDADPADWWEAVYSDTAIVTQADDGATDPTTGQGVFSSSISAPGVVFAFLELLGVRDHDRVLEIGTGTGWTAALLSWRVGAENVTSIEIDTQVAEQATANLNAAGYTPRLIVGNGAGGWPDAAPYDRIHVTCAVELIPRSWIQQTRPGGVIVLPWSPGSPCGHRVRLDVLDDSTASGRFTGAAGYMMLRSQRQDMTWNAHHAEKAEHTTTRLDPRAVADAGPGADLAITALVPRLGWHTVCEDGSLSLLLFEPGHPDGSWAACDYIPGADECEVNQYGDRRLWDEFAEAYLRWVAWGRPDRERFGMTVTPQGQHLWLDDPGHRLPTSAD